MFSFILVAVLITVIAIFVLVRPLLKHHETEAHERYQQNIHFARERLAELDQQLDKNSISAQDYEDLKLEIENNLAQDIDLAANEKNTNPHLDSSSNAVTVTLLCCLLPVLATGLYLLTGTPQAISSAVAQSDPNTAVVAGNNGPDARNSEINSLLRSLENRLLEAPDDIQGWTIAARTYQQLGRYPESIRAYRRLVELDDQNPDYFAGLADVSALHAEGLLAGAPASYVEKALSLNPQHPQAMWLAGLAAAQGGESQLALDYWHRLMPLLADFPQQQEELRAVIAQTSGVAATKPNPVSQSKPDAASTQTTAQANPQRNIEVQVSISEAVKSTVNPNATVFVFARAQQGPPAPLAARRLRVSDLPTTIKLSDSDAMMPQLTLSLFEDVVVMARISKSGNPIAQPGDIESLNIETKNNTTTPIKLVIDTVVK